MKPRLNRLHCPQRVGLSYQPNRYHIVGSQDAPLPLRYLHSSRQASSETTVYAPSAPALDSIEPPLRLRFKTSSAPRDALSILPLSVIIRTLLITSISSSPALLNACSNILLRLANSEGAITSVDRNPLLRWILKRTFYAQFCAGENVEEVKGRLEGLRKLGYEGVILEYALEVIQNSDSKARTNAESVDVDSEKTVREVETWRKGMLETVAMASPGDFVGLKWSGLGTSALHLLRSNQPPSSSMSSAIHEVCALAATRRISLLPGAEETPTNPGIETWNQLLQQRYNMAGHAVVYTTIQAYFQSAPEIVARVLAHAQRGKYKAGIKLVRGAYLASEPAHLLCPSKEATDAQYDALAERLLQRRRDGLLAEDSNTSNEVNAFPDLALVLATHNALSIRKAMAIRQQQAARSEARIACAYAQLLGMADEVSCEILRVAEMARQDGIDRVQSGTARLVGRGGGEVKGVEEEVDVPRAYKCLTWGTTGQCLQFLLRRAAENGDAVGRTREGRDAMAGELWRRYTPRSPPIGNGTKRRSSKSPPPPFRRENQAVPVASEFEPRQHNTYPRPATRTQGSSSEVSTGSLAKHIDLKGTLSAQTLFGELAENIEQGYSAAVTWLVDRLVEEGHLEFKSIYPTAYLYENLERCAAQGQTAAVKLLVNHLVEERHEHPSERLYAALIRVNVNEQHGSAADAAALLEELKDAGLTPSAALNHDMLKVLAVHPDYLVRDEILREMRGRWIALTANGWHDVVAGVLREQQYELALDRLDKMQEEGIIIQDWLYDMAIHCLVDAEELDEALRLLKERRAVSQQLVTEAQWYHMLDAASRACHYPAVEYVWRRRVETRYLNPPSGMCLNVLHTAARHGDVKLATDVFRVLGNRPTVFEHLHYEGLIDAYIASGDIRTSLTILSVMQSAGTKPDESTTRSVYQFLRQDIARCTDAFTILQSLQRDGRAVPLVALNAVLEATIYAGALPHALEQYKAVRTVCPLGPNTATFNALLRGCNLAGRKDLAMFLASEMRAMRIKPDLTTYDRLLLVCLGQEDYADAFRYFEEMRGQGFSPRPGTWHKLVQTVAGRRDERCWDLVREMRLGGLQIGNTVRWLQENWGGSGKSLEEGLRRAGVAARRADVDTDA